MKCSRSKNIKNCKCTYNKCPRKGICCECIRHHISKKELPACAFSKNVEKTYDRSFKNFIKDKK